MRILPKTGEFWAARRAGGAEDLKIDCESHYFYHWQTQTGGGRLGAPAESTYSRLLSPILSLRDTQCTLRMNLPLRLADGAGGHLTQVSHVNLSLETSEVKEAGELETVFCVEAKAPPGPSRSVVCTCGLARIGLALGEETDHVLRGDKLRATQVLCLRNKWFLGPTSPCSFCYLCLGFRGEGSLDPLSRLTLGFRRSKE